MHLKTAKIVSFFSQLHLEISFRTPPPQRCQLIAPLAGPLPDRDSFRANSNQTTEINAQRLSLSSQPTIIGNEKFVKQFKAEFELARMETFGSASFEFGSKKYIVTDSHKPHTELKDVDESKPSSPDSRKTVPVVNSKVLQF